jgi:calcineurin-like phosphoesterase family protein/uncharacterized C2H2 Zn-finger protein
VLFLKTKMYPNNKLLRTMNYSYKEGEIMKTFKCPHCSKKYVEKESLYSHIEKAHPNAIPEGTSVAQHYFNIKNKKTHGSCVICGGETKWDEATERYERFDKEICRETYREEFKKRMIDKYGKTHLLDSPDQQKKMLQNRSISGVYTWSDGKTKTSFTGSYEEDFLKFLDLFLYFNPTDVMAPAPQVFYYNDEDGTKRFYIPDFYIPSINTLVEVKDGGDNPNNHHNRQEIDARKEKIKDDIMRNQKQYNYVKVTDKNYSIFLNFLMNLKNHYADAEKQESFPIISIEESFSLVEDLILADENTVGAIPPITGPNARHNNYDERLRRLKERREEEPQGIYWQDFNESNMIIKFGGETDKLKAHENLTNMYGHSGWLLARNDISDEAVETTKGVIRQRQKMDTLVKDTKALSESANTHMEIYHLSESDLDGKTLQPRIPSNYMTKNGFEESKTARVSFAKDIDGCLRGMSMNLEGKELYVHVPESHVSTKSITNHDVPDASLTGEVWVTEPVTLKNIGKIKIGRAKDKALPYTFGGNNSAELYDWNWVWEHKNMSESEINYDGVNNIERPDPKLIHLKELDELLDSARKVWIGTDYHLWNGHKDKPQGADEKLIQNQIELVKDDDVFIYLGDLVDDTWTDKLKMRKAYRSLKGRKILILGNNDIFDEQVYRDCGFEYVLESFKYKNILFSHFPTDLKESGAEINIHGHLHWSGDYFEYPYQNHADVYSIHFGCKPVTLDFVLKKLGEGYFTPKVRHDAPTKSEETLFHEAMSLLVSLEDDETLLESTVQIDADGNLLLNLREKSDFMARYNTSHRLLKIYMETENVEGVKHELCKLWYMYQIIERFYGKGQGVNLAVPGATKRQQEALKAKAFILNDFTNGLRWINKREPDFNFDAYFAQTPYNTDVIKVDEQKIKGVKKLINALLL